MRFFIRVPLWPAALVVFCTVAGICVFIGRYPWVSASLFICALVIGARLFKDHRGEWPWQVFHRSNPEYDLDDEPSSGDYVTDTLKPYRENIADTER